MHVTSQQAASSLTDVTLTARWWRTHTNTHTNDHSSSVASSRWLQWRAHSSSRFLLVITQGMLLLEPPPSDPGGRVEGKHGRTNGRHRAYFCSNYNHFSTATFQRWTISHFLSGVVSDTVLWLGKCVQPVNTVIYPVHFVSCFIAEHECSGRRCSIDQFSVWNSDGPWPNTELWLWRTAPLQASLPGVSECALVLKLHGHTLAHPTCLTRMLLRLHHWFKPDDWEVIKIQNRSLPTQSPTHSALPQWCL